MAQWPTVLLATAGPTHWLCDSRATFIMIFSNPGPSLRPAPGHVLACHGGPLGLGTVARAAGAASRPCSSPPRNGGCGTATGSSRHSPITPPQCARCAPPSLSRAVVTCPGTCLGHPAGPAGEEALQATLAPPSIPVGGAPRITTHSARGMPLPQAQHTVSMYIETQASCREQRPRACGPRQPPGPPG